MTAFGDYDDVKYHNEGAPDNWRLTLDSRSPYGFRTTFSDFVQKRKNPETVGISIKTAETLPRQDFSLVAIDVPSFQPTRTQWKLVNAGNRARNIQLSPGFLRIRHFVLFTDQIKI